MNVTLCLAFQFPLLFFGQSHISPPCRESGRPARSTACSALGRKSRFPSAQGSSMGGERGSVDPAPAYGEIRCRGTARDQSVEPRVDWGRVPYPPEVETESVSGEKGSVLRSLPANPGVCKGSTDAKDVTANSDESSLFSPRPPCAPCHPDRTLRELSRWIGYVPFLSHLLFPVHSYIPPSFISSS
ncbi:hypothetical protein BGW80DRAFT_799294 [Lactifluus volemus]|nr:hypothetical protein BGW80DRAFT_799294 [Lactifluus volemus]